MKSDESFEREVRASLRASAAGPAPDELLARIGAIPSREPSPRAGVRGLRSVARLAVNLAAAAVVVIAAGDAARELSDRPAWIRGIDHRIEAHALGLRDLTRSVSTERAAAGAGVADGPVDLAELHTPFSHQELIVAAALGLDDDVTVNPSGGPMCANPIMTAGLIRLGEAATRISRGDGDRAVAHATSGPCLQQNLVCVLEGE